MEALVLKGKYAVVKAKKELKGAFATINDGREITSVILETKVEEKDSFEIERDWRIITFNAVLPFGLVGFLAKVSTAIAKEKVSIFALSAYSTDHILIKEKNMEKALKALRKQGFSIKKL